MPKDPYKAENKDEEAALLRLLQGYNLSVDSLGGSCPVQGEGFIGPHLRWYFRARGERWEFHVYRTRSRLFDDDVIYYSEAYGIAPFEAGYISTTQAIRFIESAVALHAENIKRISKEESEILFDIATGGRYKKDSPI